MFKDLHKFTIKLMMVFISLGFSGILHAGTCEEDYDWNIDRCEGILLLDEAYCEGLPGASVFDVVDCLNQAATDQTACEEDAANTRDWCEFEDATDHEFVDVVIGCMDVFASNYDPDAGTPGVCIYEDFELPLGCTDPAATNYDAAAIDDDGSCVFDSFDFSFETVDP